MDRNTKKAILKNRVKLLSLDYFDLTGPLLASEIFTSKKHKEIKGSAPDSKARVDLLLEWLEESAPKDAFPLFLQGFKNCDEAMLAKRIKKEAEGKGGAPTSSSTGGGASGKPRVAKPKLPKQPHVPTASSINLDKLLADIIPSLPASFGSKQAANANAAGGGGPADKPKKPKKPKSAAPPLPPGLLPPPPPINGLPSGQLLPPPAPVTTTTTAGKKRKAADDGPKVNLPKGLGGGAAAGKKGGAAGTPGKGAAGKGKGPGQQNQPAGSRGSTPKSTTSSSSAAASAAAAAAAAAAAIMATTPRTTRKSSSSDIVQVKGKGGATPKGGKNSTKKTGPAAAAASPKNKAGGGGAGASAPPMTFKAVEDKQQDFKNKFKFTNSNAIAKSILFKDKSDITYLGCPFLDKNKMCGKKVELKSKEFICEAKHKSPNCRQIPRLQVTCNDGSADLILTHLKQNVEVFTGKSETEIETLSVDEIKVMLDKTTGKKLNVEVACEKAKKQGAVKKGSPARWNNVATIIDESGEAAADNAPPNKKKRKN